MIEARISSAAMVLVLLLVGWAFLRGSRWFPDFRGPLIFSGMVAIAGAAFITVTLLWP